MTKIYETCLSLARDPDSEFYVSPNGIRVGHPDEEIEIAPNGTIKNRRTGASHRNRFWQGYRDPNRKVRGKTMGDECFRAGQAFRRERE